MEEYSIGRHESRKIVSLCETTEKNLLIGMNFFLNEIFFSFQRTVCPYNTFRYVMD